MASSPLTPFLAEAFAALRLAPLTKTLKVAKAGKAAKVIKAGKVHKSLRILRYRGGLSGRWFALTSCLGGVVAVGLLAMAAGSHHHSPLRATADVLIGPGGLALAVAAVAVAALRR